VPIIDPNAVHEAGHVIAGLCGRLKLTGIFVDKRGKYSSQFVFDPTHTPPLPIYAMKIGGYIAVEVQNEKLRRHDDHGFGTKDQWDSDATAVECMKLYWKNQEMTAVQIDEFEITMRNSIKQTLQDHGATLEALALQIERLSLVSPHLGSAMIGAIIKDIEPKFYEAIKAQLVEAG
jgi:hypothetical protein